jgi:RNA polymerase sigma-70 factor (ECF subfamily)
MLRTMHTTDPYPTRQSLLIRLKDWDDHEAWKRFHDTYHRLIFSTAIRAGLTESEADDVVQETVVAVAKKMHDFKYDPATSSFKTWLQTLTRRRIADQFRERSRQVPTVDPPPDEDTETEPLQCLADPASLVPDARWEEDWKTNLLAAARERLREKVSPEQFQIYDYHAIQRHSVAQTSKALGVTAARVYLAKLRVGRQLAKEIAALREGLL